MNNNRQVSERSFRIKMMEKTTWTPTAMTPEMNMGHDWVMAPATSAIVGAAIMAHIKVTTDNILRFSNWCLCCRWPGLLSFAVGSKKIAITIKRGWEERSD